MVLLLRVLGRDVVDLRDVEAATQKLLSWLQLRQLVARQGGPSGLLGAPAALKDLPLPLPRRPKGCSSMMHCMPSCWPVSFKKAEASCALPRFAVH